VTQKNTLNVQFTTLQFLWGTFGIVATLVGGFFWLSQNTASRDDVRILQGDLRTVTADVAVLKDRIVARDTTTVRVQQ